MSGNTNIVIIEGRVVRDPEYSKIKTGSSICKFSIANNRYYYSNNQVNNEVSFFDFVSWGRLADNAALNMHKGAHVFITGEIKQNTYKSKTGENKTKIYILALEIKYLGKKEVANKPLYDSSNSSYNNDVNTVKTSIDEKLDIVL